MKTPIRQAQVETSEHNAIAQRTIANGNTQSFGGDKFHILDSDRRRGVQVDVGLYRNQETCCQHGNANCQHSTEVEV